ncbi:unnamed protein product [Prorocentrum cordatum]|uniref:Uncharacterized protein n=2 Tax=Prorocentrum cordatum TaxID=2364126 RepID=A0ABN9VUQ0_9DINO|nr:unnamed protein product [Polarella glacialis]
MICTSGCLTVVILVGLTSGIAKAMQLGGPGASASPPASRKGNSSWLLGIRTHGAVVCSVADDCIVGSGLGHCSVQVDPAMKMQLGSTDAGAVHNSSVQYNNESEITITGHAPSSRWSLCRATKDAEEEDPPIAHPSMDEVCYEVDGLPGLCFLWASPCSGGCSSLRPFIEYYSICPGMRYASAQEWSIALPDLNAHRKDFYTKCAVGLLDPWWHHCDYANAFVRQPDDGWNELVLVCDTSIPAIPGFTSWGTGGPTGTMSATGGPAPTPMPLPPPPGPGLVPCGLTGGYSSWPEDATCASWIQGAAQGGGANVYVGTVDTCHHCILAVLTAYPSAKGATFRTPGLTSQAGECYAEDGWLYPDGNPSWITIPVIASLQYYTDLASDPCNPAFNLTMKPTPAPTPAPTPSPPTPSPTVPAAPPTGGGGSSISAVGDPHLQNIYGERFDLMRPGKHVLINIPRGALAENALLQVEADAQNMGARCADMYFQELNITGAWVQGTKQDGGLRFRAQDVVDGSMKWEQFGKVELKVVHGRTKQGTQYLNLYAKRLDRTGLAVGGLLGEDDHSEAALPPRGCAQTLSLIQGKLPFTRQRQASSVEAVSA